ncbi:sigma-54-dependent transcriptional regulator [Marinimicrobium koreense]|uniref:sigma-54-dependent transcriptional regulator n=1 Tax=Marinimicrobium koreense TaxID=306545 RepID=UPI003F71CAC2
MAQAARQASPAMARPRILVVEDDADLREALTDTLELADYEVLQADSGEQALTTLNADSDCQMIVSDVNMGGMSGQELLQAVKQQYPQIPMMLITAYASINQSVDAIKQGAVDYLVKPFEPALLVDTLARHLGSTPVGDEPVVRAASSQRLLQLAQRVAQSESTVLILGESGTGKEVLARYIQNHSPRHQKPFVAINCAAIPENMLEAMLFGHEKGAYTGAHTSAPGKFEQANGGTLLLDEISEMDVGLQAKLLRVLQEREVERLGGRKTIPLDVRVIATSNRDMREQVAKGLFREDLYYRLSVLPLQWAPLRERREDIVPLAEQLLRKHAQKQRRGWVQLTDSARQALTAYDWPGNVRELDNVMQRALILQPGDLIQAEDLGLEADRAYADLASGGGAGMTVNDADPMAVTPVSEPVSLPHQGTPAPVSDVSEEKPALGSDLKRREFEIIVNTLNSERGSKKRTAERLGISPRTLRYKMARLREAGFPVDGLA